MQTGGFIGISKSVQVSSDGQLLAVDKRSGVSATTQLPLESLAELGKLYSQALGTEPSQQPSACADCFVYDLQLTSDGKTVSIHLDDISLPDSGAEPLINYLRQLRDAALTNP